MSSHHVQNEVSITLQGKPTQLPCHSFNNSGSSRWQAVLLVLFSTCPLKISSTCAWRSVGQV